MRRNKQNKYDPELYENVLGEPIEETNKRNKKPKKKKVNITCSISVARINSHFSLFTSSYFAQVKELLVDELKQNKDYYYLINIDSIYFDAESPYHADDELHIVFKCGFNGRVGNKTKSIIHFKGCIET